MTILLKVPFAVFCLLLVALPTPPQDRSALPLQKALLGHWVLEGRKDHMYYNGENYISVYSGRIFVGNYTLEEINEQERTLRVRINKLHSRLLSFAEDKNTYVDKPEVAGQIATDAEAYHWKHVDDNQKPSPEVVQSTQGEEPTLDAVTVQEVPQQEAPQPELVIGDSRTKVFYWRGCPEYEKLPTARRVYFKTRAAARGAGYHAAKTCP
ncbi:MAG TPA: hypothetical protein VKA60_12850 [Blastocatellia bacterium]|nr:hypothetical protein [Blastocatellia bacterium]